MSDPTLEDLDAVGSSRAALLREHGYTSVESLLETSPAELVEIDGIGDATATDILASAVRVLDRSEPTVATPRVNRGTPVIEPIRPLPFPRPPSDRSTTIDRPRSTDVPSEDTAATGSVEIDHEAVRETLRTAGTLVEYAAGGRGRIGRTPLDPSAVTPDITVRYRPRGYFDVDAREVLADAGISDRETETLLEHETALLERLQSDEAFAAGYTLDTATALADLDDPLGERLALLVQKPTHRRPTDLGSLGGGTMRVQVGDADTDGGR
jgi:hypothetical protein